MTDSHTTPRTNPLAASLKSKYSLVPQKDTSISKVAPSSRRLISLESDRFDEIGNTDYFSRSKQLLITSTRNFKVPQLEPPSTTNELQSSIKSPSKFRTSFSSTNRNKVKFDLENTTQSIFTQTQDRFAAPERLSKSPDRPSRVELERERDTFSSRINPMASAKPEITGKVDRSQVIGDIASRINSLEQRMDFDAKKLSTSLSQFPPQASSRTQNNASILKTEASLSLEPKDEDIIPRRSRLKFFSTAGDTFTPNETVVTSQDNRGGQDGEIQYSKSYVENLRRNQKEKMTDLEDKLRSKHREFEDYKSHSSSRLGEFKDELSKTTERHGEEIRKVQRELDYETSKRLQENEFEIKTLKNKVRDLEEQLGTANRKVENLQKELRASELFNKDLSTDQRSASLKYETELASIQEQGNIKIQQLNEKHEKERKRLKESYERLVEELSNDNKQTYKKLNEEVAKREKRIKELERENEHIQRDLYSKIEHTGHDNQVLYETNRAHKKNLEESREEVLKLTAQLDDKKREVYILETQVELLKTEKSRYESEWLKGGKSPLRKLNASTSTNKGRSSSKNFTSPK